ncbi:MAG: VOC family protein [Thermoleophilaceae bacterium]|nr:VOC family protein [Thermoleophilaceae bacterium]
MRMIFVNLPVKDLNASKDFFTALDFGFNADYTDEQAACMIVDENIFVMLLTEERFKDFINGDIADAASTTEAINCLSANSKDEVDTTIEKALAAGGSEWKPKMEHGPMYSASFQDLDGHVWELMHMAT